jgi:hypothetical protein
MKERPRCYNLPFKSEDLELLEIRFHKDDGHFFVDLPTDQTITDESLRLVRHKLATWISDETATDDSDWEDKLLISDAWDDDSLLEEAHARTTPRNGEWLHIHRLQRKTLQRLATAHQQAE